MSRYLRIVNFARFQPGVANRQYVRLYVDERGSFAMLPVYTRAFAAELLKFCDGEGRVDLGGREPAQALALLMGARGRHDRNRIKLDLDRLEEDGYLTIDPREAPVARAKTPAAGPSTTPTGPLPDTCETPTDPLPDACETPAGPLQDTCGTATASEFAEQHGETTQERITQERRGEERRGEVEEMRGRERARGDGPAGPAKAGPKPVRVTDLETAQRRLGQLLGAAWWEVRGCPLPSEATETREAATWIWQVVRADADGFVALAERLVATWKTDPYLRERRVRMPVANFAKRIQSLYDDVVGRHAVDAPAGPPASVSALMELRAQLADLKRQRDLAIGNGDHDRVRAIEAEQERVRAAIQKAKGKAA